METDFRPQAQEEEAVRILFIGAHPDDCELKAGGTAALLAEHGHEVKFAALTNGAAGHHEMDGDALAKRRRAESKVAARRLGIAEYELLDYPDGEFMPTLEARRDVIRLIREWNADAVVSHRPYDYHPDHRYVARVVQDAAFMVQVPRVLPEVAPTDENPVFLYFQDRFEKPYAFEHDITIAIDEVIGRKIDALHAHESQFYEFLPWVRGVSDEVPESETARKKWVEKRWIDPLSEVARENMSTWYGPGTAEETQYAESFQVAEYGHQPTSADICRLFPMLPTPNESQK